MVVAMGWMAGAACATGGAREPDAAAIVAGAAGPGVHVDSTDAPFVVALERARWQAREGDSQALDFWTAIARLDVTRAARAARSVDERTFATAVRSLMASEIGRAHV